MIRLLAALAALTCFACTPSQGSICADCAPGTGGVEIALTMPAGGGIGRVTATVSAPDIQPAITQDLTLAGVSPVVATGVIANVPAGTGRLVTLEARAVSPEQDLVVFRGAGTTDVAPGLVPSLRVTLRPVVKDLPVGARFPASGAALAPVHHVAVAVSGARIAAPATFYLSLDAAQGLATGTVSAVPVGASRTVTASAFDAGGALLYQGSADTAVLEGAPSPELVVSLASVGAGGIGVIGTVCVPVCGAAVCGDDGCGGSCGGCPPAEACSGGACVATSDPAQATTALRTMAGFWPFAIWGAGQDDVWMWSKRETYPLGGLMEHWDGSTWTTTAGISGLDRIGDLWGTATNDVWAVGYVGDATGLSELGAGVPPTGLIFHWNGATWAPSLVTTLVLPNAAWGSSASDVWAAGFGTHALHWNGSTWSSFPLGVNTSVTALWGSGPTDVYAATGPALYHWDGHAWSSTTLPLPANETSSLMDVWGSSSVDVWVVGVGQTPGSGVGGSVADGHVWHWDGTSWSVQEFANTGFGVVRGTGPHSVWAFGGGDGAYFDGSTWTTVPFDSTSSFADAWVAGPNELWALRTVWLPGTSGEVLRVVR